MKPFPFEKLTPREAVQFQKKLRDRVVTCPLELQRIRYVAGADISYDTSETTATGFLLRKNSNTVFAGVVVLSLPRLEVVDRSVIRTRVNFPYVPGLLSFRESAAIVKAWSRLRIRPDVLLVDGHGLAHPRRFGIACHLGLLLGIPTVGCGKSILVGEFDEERLSPRRGSHVRLAEKSETIGWALRTRGLTNPIFISVGHKSDLTSACRLVLRCSPRYRIPEPTRLAHQLVNSARRGETPAFRWTE